MRRVWATAGTVWAVLGVTAVLAWSQARPSAPATSPAVAVVKAAKPGTAPVAVALPAATAAPHATTHTS